ncbi:DNA polymerase I [Glycomyces artemisiae]|uniref:DNA polymerase I n=1 Tax=Glycomyces artemisiae TaxID=1076443 RepID=A0A2T0UH15_9ACTN|nr:DNA polymerase I [Glycomyces artemisiae]PRY57243.1 DNA polymerase I [Glycomyces artemisiae]
MTASQSRLLLIDGHSMAYRAFFALPAEKFATDDGQVTNAVYGFASMLINLLKAEKPTHVAVAFDVSRHSFRTDEYAAYKDGRGATPDEFKSQIPIIKQLLDAFGIAWLTKETFEADDIIATLATQGEAAGLATLISSGDRDAIQLVNDAVTLLYPVKGVTELARYTPEAVEEKYGVTPERYRDLAALVGEKADNLPGIPGVGPKTAAKWITKYGSLDGLVAKADEITGKAGQSLRDHLDDVMRNHRLNRLVTDVELDKAVADLEWHGWDVAETNSLFDALQFRALGDRLNANLADKAVGAAVAPVAETAQVETAVLVPGGLAAWLGERTGDVAVAFTGTFASGAGSFDTIALAEGGQALWFEPSQLDAEDERSWTAWLADPRKPKLVHDAKAFLWGADAAGWPEPAGLKADTMIAAYLLKPEQRSYALGDLAMQYLGRELETAQTAADDGALFSDAALAGQPADDDTARVNADCTAAAVVAELAAEQSKRLEQRHQAALADDLEFPIIGVLARMEITGIAADEGHFADIESGFAAQSKDATDRAHEIVGRPFNVGSPKQLQEILFEELKMPKTKRTKTGYTTNAEALQQLLVKTGHPLLEQLLRFRDVEKLKQIVATLRATIQTDGRIHTTFHQTVAATGRLSSADPNLQNIPVRSEAGRAIRAGFVVSEGFESLMTIDYSQIEMRIMASLTGDEGLIDAFIAGEDIHSAVAAKVFGVGLGEVSAEHRRKIKAMSYGLAYGLSTYGLSQQLGISNEEAQQLSDDYFARFGKVRDYLHRVVEEARKTGYTETIMGRRRYFPDLTSDNRQLREIAERAALNAPIQGSAADIMKTAMLGVDRALREAKLDSRVILQVHDELVCEVAPGEAERLESLVREQMSNAATLAVPLTVAAGFGSSWEDAAH